MKSLSTYLAIIVACAIMATNLVGQKSEKRDADVPRLVRQLKQPKASRCCEALDELRKLGTEAKDAVPVVIARLQAEVGRLAKGPSTLWPY
jgi:hypothetical protein